MKFKIGQTVARQNPGGGETIHQIKTDEHVQRYTDQANKTVDGVPTYKFTLLGGEVDALDFELPDTSANAPVTKPRVQIAGDVCTACEA
jgi:hypothetical protein